MHSSKFSSRGFTLLEIMVVIVIIGIIAAFVAPNIFGETERAQITKAKADIVTLENALERYKIDNYQYPATDQGLEALVQKPDGDPEPRNYKRGGYLKRLQQDPWGNPYQYLNPGEFGEVDIYSLGADGEIGGEGMNQDIGNWNLNEIELPREE